MYINIKNEENEANKICFNIFLIYSKGITNIPLACGVSSLLVKLQKL